MSWPNNYVGIPFKEKGRDEAGADCWGLVRLIYARELGIDLPSYVDAYASTNERETLSELIGREKETDWREVKDHKPFDVVLIRMRGLPMHVGVVTKKGAMIHCQRGSNAAVEPYNGLKWRHKIVGVFRWEN